MAFSERIKKLAKKKSAHRCCVCYKTFVEIHHLIPQQEGGPDTLENAVPLCSSCHDLFGGNPDKRKALKQIRDDWWEVIEERRKRITDEVDLDRYVEIEEDPHYLGRLNSKMVAIYHVVLKDEDFTAAANHVFSLIRETQNSHPNIRRCLFLDIDGHRNSEGGFDHDMFELQRHFILGFAFRWLYQVHTPLFVAQNKKAQKNDLPDKIEVLSTFDQGTMNYAIDNEVEEIWVADRDKRISLK